MSSLASSQSLSAQQGHSENRQETDEALIRALENLIVAHDCFAGARQMIPVAAHTEAGTENLGRWLCASLYVAIEDSCIAIGTSATVVMTLPRSAAELRGERTCSVVVDVSQQSHTGTLLNPLVLCISDAEGTRHVAAAGNYFDPLDGDRAFFRDWDELDFQTTFIKSQHFFPLLWQLAQSRKIHALTSSLVLSTPDPQLVDPIVSLAGRLRKGLRQAPKYDAGSVEQGARATVRAARAFADAGCAKTPNQAMSEMSAAIFRSFFPKIVPVAQKHADLVRTSQVAIQRITDPKQ